MSSVVEDIKEIAIRKAIASGADPSASGIICLRLAAGMEAKTMPQPQLR